MLTTRALGAMRVISDVISQYVSSTHSSANILKNGGFIRAKKDLPCNFIFSFLFNHFVSFLKVPMK